MHFDLARIPAMDADKRLISTVILRPSALVMERLPRKDWNARQERAGGRVRSRIVFVPIRHRNDEKSALLQQGSEFSDRM